MTNLAPYKFDWKIENMVNLAAMTRVGEKMEIWKFGIPKWTRVPQLGPL